ncbi:MAG: ABC transporter substrate-binding protein [Leptolyngbya sp. BL-A-14]
MHFSKAHHWTRRQALWLMTGAIAGTGLHACAKPAATPSAGSSSSAAGSAMSINLGIAPWIGFTPLHIAIEKGFYKALGLDLKVKVFDTNAQTFPAFTAGQVDGFAPVTSEAITLAAKGVDLKIVMVEDNSLGADVVMARNSIKSIKDFKGKRIAVEIGGIGHFFVLQILAEAGLTGQDVTLVNTPPDAAAIGYQTGKIDIAYSYSPFSEKAIAAQTDGRVIYSSKQMPTAIVDVYLFSTKFVQSNPKAIAAFVEGTFKGAEFLKTNRQEGVAIGAKQLKVTPAELDQQLKGIRTPDLSINKAMLGDTSSKEYLLPSMTKLADFLKAQGQIQTIPDLKAMLDPQFVNAMKA